MQRCKDTFIAIQTIKKQIKRDKKIKCILKMQVQNIKKQQMRGFAVNPYF